MKAFGSKRELQLFVVVVFLAGISLWVYYTLLFKPMFQEAVRLGQEVRTASLKLQHTEQAITQEPQLRQEYERLQEALQGLRKALPPPEDLPSVIGLLSDVASQTSVKIQTIFPQRSLEDREETPRREPASSDVPELYTEIPIQIDALTGFHQLGTFLSRVESGAQPMQLRSIRITENGFWPPNAPGVQPRHVQA